MNASAPLSRTPFPPPRDKKTLVAYITEAAMLEHQFMCQYLYAALSLKKQPDVTCSPAQLEVVRRWASTLYTIARQEMEHLSVANSLLTAVGAKPWFGHENFPTQSRWYEASALARRKLAADDPDPCDFPFLLQAFDLSVVERFCCMESPDLDLVAHQDRRRMIDWCYQRPDGACACVPELPEPPPPARSFVGGPDAAPNTVEPGTVQELYSAIEEGLRYLSAHLGSRELFSGHQSGQSQLPSEYDIYLFAIHDLDTAVAGVRMIRSQGEGIDTPPGYESHYQNFYDMAVEYTELLAEDPAFEPALPLPLNPQPGQYTDPVTADAVGAFSAGYSALLYMLAGYYANYSLAEYARPPYLLAALEQTTFAPAMTMLVRSLGELIVHLPANAHGAPAGPNFTLSPLVLERLSNPQAPLFLDINFHVANLREVAEQLEAVLAAIDPSQPLRSKFQYVHQNVVRMMANLQYVYENGIFSKFANLPHCSPGES